MPTPNLSPDSKYTFKQFESDFPDDAACMAWLVAHLYPQGKMHCLGCSEVRPHHQLKSRPKVWSCDYCGTHTHPTAGTIFHKSKTSLKTWFHAIYLMSATRCGISAMQLMREMGVTYKCAWRMFTLIRKMLLEDVHSMGGSGKVVEADETYVGGYKRGKQYLGGVGKIVVAGAVERSGRVAAYVLPDGKARTIMPPLQSRVLPESTLYTDDSLVYKHARKHFGVHKTVKHLAKVYVDGDVHTNTIEGYWSLVKRGISGVYHSVSRKHLQGYLDEYAFRYNHRKDGKPMFKILCGQVSQEFLQAHYPAKHRPRKVTF